MAKKRSKEAFKKQAGKKAYEYELQYHGCSQAVLRTFQELLGLDDELLFKAAGPLCAGLGTSKTCGALMAGAIALGMKNGRARLEDGIEGLFPGLLAAQNLVRKFEREFGTTSCSEISKIDWTDSGAVVNALSDPEFVEGCAQVVGKTAEMVADLIEE